MKDQAARHDWRVIMIGALGRHLSWRRAFVALAIVVMSGVGLDRMFPPDLTRAQSLSQWVTDSDGRPLRAFPATGAYWRFPADIETVDPAFVDALLAVEDRRFRRHWGVDWVGLARAGFTSLKAGEIVSGGSTITMQTARLLEPRPRTLTSKFIEIIRAHQLEARLSKDEILELYLTLAPYGGNLEGIRAASWRYFGTEPDRLSDDQIVLLVALPQAPEARRPDRRPKGAKAGRDSVVRKLVRAGVFTPEQGADVAKLDVLASRTPFPDRAWHAAAAARVGSKPRIDLQATLDGRLQTSLEALMAEAREPWPDAVQAAVMVIDVPTRAVLASVGSVGRDRPGGWIDLTAQARSPGSTLKPFIYGLAFDDGLAAPGTKIGDLPRRFDAYQPENFDRSFRGDVTISDALQHSLNVPAVLALAEVGPARFASVLSAGGAQPRISGPLDGEAGLALALGGAGMTVRDIGVLYAALGDGGVAKPLVWQADHVPLSREAPGQRLMSRASAEQIVDVLAGTPPPEGRMPARLTTGAPKLAFKTGTSYGFRDAWAAGLSGDTAIVVWVGRADGAPRPGETGRTAALPILFDVADLAGRTLRRETRPWTSMEQSSALAAPPVTLSTFEKRGTPPDILFPPRDAELWAGSIDGKPSRAFVFSGRGEGPLDWYVDGVAVPLDDGHAPSWAPSRSGFYTVSAVDREGRRSNVRVRVIGAPPA
ncbi:MAG: penicillin-binding protein 1C [Pseudomonadota bacterium]